MASKRQAQQIGTVLVKHSLSVQKRWQLSTQYLWIPMRLSLVLFVPVPGRTQQPTHYPTAAETMTLRWNTGSRRRIHNPYQRFR